ncbi:hypothetical protein SAY86_027600 [Trapa natans]|uniref:DUF7725 domain-containing protein n=1 Tax=Trapa natans TaxID=22666 RepID=A0AAN7KTC8_TRANT|nr:hypothetical protein SAY86_027600 [Trapa natans]
MVRTIPAGGRIHIGSTLPNRLGKMLSPLHWHDYKKRYGKLDDFVYLVVKGDYVRLREGAQEMIAAVAAVAKVSGAAAAPALHSSALSSVVVTPMAQSYRPKNGPSTVVNNIGPTSAQGHLQLLPAQNPHPSAIGSAVGSNVKILSKSKNPPDPNGLGIQSASINGRANIDSAGLGKGVTNGKHISNFIGKPPSRMSGQASGSRR